MVSKSQGASIACYNINEQGTPQKMKSLVEIAELVGQFRVWFIRGGIVGMM